MAKFTIIYNENGTVTRILEFLGRTYTYEWNRSDMIHPDFREPVLSVKKELACTHIAAILNNLSYYNDDLPGQVRTLTDYEEQKGAADTAPWVPP